MEHMCVLINKIIQNIHCERLNLLLNGIFANLTFNDSSNVNF